VYQAYPLFRQYQEFHQCQAYQEFQVSLKYQVYQECLGCQECRVYQECQGYQVYPECRVYLNQEFQQFQEVFQLYQEEYQCPAWYNQLTKSNVYIPITISKTKSKTSPGHETTLLDSYRTPKIKQHNLAKSTLILIFIS
jgi:hypothetical protein